MSRPGSSVSPSVTSSRSSTQALSRSVPPAPPASSSTSSPPSSAVTLHLTSSPINPQSLEPGSLSLTSSDQPMPSSATTSDTRSSISSQHTRTTAEGGPPSKTETTSMPSNGTSKTDGSTLTKTQGDSDQATDVPTGATTEGTTSKTSDPPPPTTTSHTTTNRPPTTTGGGTRTNPPDDNPAPGTNPTHTSTSVAVVHPSNTSTIFTTVTSSPESTLSVPSSIPITNSINGIVSLTAPPMVTVLSTSTQPDGAYVTFTHVVANPGSVDTSRASTGFLQNQGQVAGVFTVVGIVASALIAALIWFVKRHRRRQRRKAWFASLRQYPPSPFADSYREPNDANYMRSVQTTSEGMHEPHMVSYHDVGYRPRSQPDSTGGSAGLGLTGVGTMAEGAIVPLRRPLSGGDPFRDPPNAPRNTPVSHRDRFTEPSGVSIAPSSPSVYPESLPPTDDSPSPVDSEPRTQLKVFPEPFLHRSLSAGHAGVPPRPPRSHLRDSHKPTGILPLTPPSSHGHSKGSSPEMDFAGLPEPFTPRTWRNARPRTAPETSQASGGAFGPR